MNPVSVQNLVCRFKKDVALDDVSFELPPGTITCLLGENGAGKSTLIKALLGLLPASEGQVAVLGHDPVKHGRYVRERTGYVPDAPDAPKWMTPSELYHFLRPQYHRWDEELVARLAARFGLPLETPLKSLSRGQAAKAMLIAALAPKPEVLLFDEAFSGLDPVSRKELLGGFLEELTLEKVCVLLATHDLDLAARVADRVMVLANGRLQAQGALDEVLPDLERQEVALPEEMYGLLQRTIRTAEREREPHLGSTQLSERQPEHKEVA